MRLAMCAIGIGFALSASSALAADAAKGEQLFRIQCASCHSFDPAKTLAGPSLDGIVGSEAGKVPGFKYSAALQSSSLVWDEETLSEFLAAPADLVPGTSMIVRVAGEAQRADIIAYLATKE